MSQASKMVSKRQRVVAVLAGVIVLAIVQGLMAIAITPLKYDVAAGDISPVTITASRDVEDTVATQAAREQAKQDVTPVYVIDENVTTDADIAGYFNTMADIIGDLKTAYVGKMVLQNGGSKEDYAAVYDPSEIDWESELTDTQVADIKTRLGDEVMPDSAVYALAAMDEAAVLTVKEVVRDAAGPVQSAGIQEDGLQAAKDALDSKLSIIYSDPDLQYLAFVPIDTYLTANMTEDTAATQQAQEEAAEAVEPVMVMKNQTVVVEDSVVTEAQMAVLRELGVGGGGANILLYVGMFLFITAMFCVYAVYLYQFESNIVAETRKLVILGAIIVLIVAIAVPLARLDVRIVPVFFGTMLASVLVSRKSALALNVFLAFIVGAACAWSVGLMSLTMLSTVTVTIIGGTAAVLALYRPAHRASLIVAGLVAGGVNVAVVVLMNLVSTQGLESGTLLTDCVFALGSALLASVLAIGTLPIWEAVFRVSTPAKLIELSDPNHPLLKRLTMEAPGTYHHSIRTANLAEAGADALGVNALLCRVGAYYHDVGKLKNPMYFKENQRGENPHDTLDPKKSVRIITDHLTYGLELAQKYKLPREVQRILMQHHGTTVVEYFYHKAQEADMAPVEAQYRYQGSKPATKEAAVVMLADSVEAAVTSIGEPDKEQIKDMINKLIRKRYNDGQLDDSGLNRQELNDLARAFLGVFDGAFHERIKYPGQE